jgi:hypothetical protein
MKQELELALALTSLLTDEIHLKYHEDCVESIKNQTELPDLFLASSHIFRGDLREIYGSKLQKNKGSVDSILNSKNFLPHFKQLYYLVKKLSDKDGDYCWVFFSGDDGIWHPDRTKQFKDAIKNVQSDERIDCIAIPNETKHLNQKREIHCAEHVDLALQEHQIDIKKWLPDPNGSNIFEMHDICVRLKVLRDFFKKTPEELLWNAYCDVQFTNFAIEYKPVFHLVQTTTSWSYFWRAPDKRYVDMTGKQWSSMRFEGQSVIQLIPLMIKIAEMACCPEMEITAKKNLESNLSLCKDELDRVYVHNQYLTALKEKPWIKRTNKK